jgi:hypothetical protein
MSEVKPAKLKFIATIALELVLVAIIIGLLVATWLPAIIGANPDMQRSQNLRH